MVIFDPFFAVDRSKSPGMIDTIISSLRAVWESLLERLFFLPPFPESIDSLALFSLLLVVGLLIGEWLHAHAKWPKVIGYVLSGIVFLAPHCLAGSASRPWRRRDRLPTRRSVC